MNQTNRKILPLGLWVVATPIGNLDDLTPRAAGALEQATWILCEDTRRTAQLLSALGIALGKNRLSRFDAHSDAKQVEKWIRILQEGASIALVTDAGTPSISDPGSLLVAAAHREGIRVTPVPGVSAVATFLSVAGLMGSAFYFGGFFPRKSSEQLEVLQKAACSPLAQIYIWFESPHRIQEALEKVEVFCREHAVDAVVIAAKELTKIHEHLFRGAASHVSQQVRQELASEGVLGEWCFAVEFSKRKLTDSSGMGRDQSHEESWRLTLVCLIEEGVNPSQAVKRVSRAFGISKNRVYEHAIEVQKKI